MGRWVPKISKDFTASFFRYKFVVRVKTAESQAVSDSDTVTPVQAVIGYTRITSASGCGQFTHSAKLHGMSEWVRRRAGLSVGEKRYICPSQASNSHFLPLPVTTLAELPQLPIQRTLVTSVPFLHSGGRGMLPPLWSSVAKFLLVLPQLVNSSIRNPATGCLESS
jgi:hypothetical protein